MNSSLNRPAPKMHIIFAFVFSFALGVLLYMGQVKPKALKVQELDKQYKALQDEIRTLEDFNQKVKAVRQKQIQEGSAQVQKSNTSDPRLQLLQKARAPEFRLFEDFMRKIMSVHFRPSVDIDALNYKNRIEYSGFSETEFEISANGPYVNVMTFMERLEGLPSLLTIKDFDLEVGKTDNSNVILKIKASFYQLQDDMAN